MLGSTGLRDIFTELESVGNMLSAHWVEIKGLLQGTFLELERITDFSARVIKEFIVVFLSAQLVKTARLRAIQKISREKLGEQINVYGRVPDRGCEILRCHHKLGKEAHIPRQGQEATTSSGTL